MGTVTFNMEKGLFKKPKWENDYSIHLQNHLSREEFSRCMKRLQTTTTRYYPNRSWSVFLLIVSTLIPWAIFFVGIAVNSFLWPIFLAVFVLGYVPIIVWGLWYGAKICKTKDLLASDMAKFNTEFEGRQVNWRLRTAKDETKSHNMSSSFSAEIEFGNQQDRVSTVTFNMVKAPSKKPKWENDYSIHLQNHLSREEFSRCMKRLENTTSRYYPNYSFSVILTSVLTFIPWAIFLFFIIKNPTYHIPTGTYFGSIGVSLIPIIIWTIWFKTRIHNIRKLFFSDISYFNTEFEGRQINWRLRTFNLSWASKDSNSENNHSQYSFSIEIELGTNNNMVYQHPGKTHPGFVTPVYVVTNMEEPNYSEKEALLV